MSRRLGPNFILLIILGSLYSIVYLFRCQVYIELNTSTFSNDLKTLNIYFLDFCRNIIVLYWGEFGLEKCWNNLMIYTCNDVFSCNWSIQSKSINYLNKFKVNACIIKQEAFIKWLDAQFVVFVTSAQLPAASTATAMPDSHPRLVIVYERKEKNNSKLIGEDNFNS